MKMTLLSCVCLVLALAKPGFGATDGVPRENMAKLAEPLNKLACNLNELEKSGYFAITKVEFSRTKEYDEEAMLWTVKVLKPVSIQHAMILLKQVRKVRFYRTQKEKRMPLMTTELYYPAWFEIGAINHEFLDSDHEFQIYILLTAVEAKSLNMHKVDTVEFTVPQRTIR